MRNGASASELAMTLKSTRYALDVEL